MSCEIPERTEQAYLHNGHEYMLCMAAQWGNYQDQRYACITDPNKTCEQKQQCEAQAWADYLLFTAACGDQHPENGCGCG